jgi:hypothetical protein
MFIMAMIASVYAFAQETGANLDVNVTKTTETTTWYANPWVWIIGAAVFILLFAAIVRGSGNRTDA